LNKFLEEAQYKYEVGMNDMVRKPSLSWREFVDIRIVKSVFRLQLLGSFSTHIRKYFKNPKIIKLLEFPVLFLGAKPKDTPALYSLMNYADIKLGTWYPMKGMSEVAAAFEKIAYQQGVTILFNANVQKIEVENNSIKTILVNDKKHSFDYVVSSADYHHTDQNLLGDQHASYSKKYWNSRKLSPSCLLYFIGINKKIPNLEHHNLFFDTDYEKHSNEIYDTPKFPSEPLFYVCCPSKTDNSIAPENCENLFILIPVAPDLDDSTEIQEKYLDICIKRLEKRTETSIRNSIIVQRNFGINDFKNDYNSFKGNAYGMASTLFQTAFLKPKIKHKKIKNMFFCGQLTVPGPGVPPSIISGEIVANYIIKNEKNI